MTTTPPVRITEPCGRCSGQGVIPQYGHRFHGECFKCHGKGTVTVLASTVKARKTRESRHIAACEHDWSPWRTGGWRQCYLCNLQENENQESSIPQCRDWDDSYWAAF
jgi:hypothetical protein